MEKRAALPGQGKGARLRGLGTRELRRSQKWGPETGGKEIGKDEEGSG